VTQQTSQKDGPAASSDGSLSASLLDKVQLDIDDAPFLQEAKPAESPALSEESSLAVPGAEARPAKSKKKLLAVVAAAVVLLGGAALLLFFGGDATPPPQPPVIVVPAAPPFVLPTAHTMALEPFWVDLRTPAGERIFLVVTFTASTPELALYREMEDKLVTLRDAIYYYLRNKDYAFLADQNNMETIRTDLLSTVNNYLVQGELKDLWYDSYLMK
jgi:flagellar FliL protein